MTIRALTLAALLIPATTFAQANLQPILARLDTASAAFHNAQAQVKYDNYTAVIKAHDVQTGSLYIERSGKSVTMGALFFDPGTPNTPARVLNYDGRQLRLYTPGTNQEDVFSAGNNQAKYESFLTLGFGGSGHDLAAQWDITDQGPETVNGIKAEKLDLVSKDPNVRNMFKHVTIWLDLNRGLSVRQVFYQPNGDYRTADYTDIKENSSINRKTYAINGKNISVIRH